MAIASKLPLPKSEATERHANNKYCARADDSVLIINIYVALRVGLLYI